MPSSPRLVVDRTAAAPSVPWSAPSSSADACPVARLASQAAAVLRAMKAMGHDDLRDDETEALERGAFPAWAAFESQADGPAPEYVAKSLYKKAEAMRDLAMHFPATSLKGALFQIYIAGGKAGWISGELVEGRVHKDDLAHVHVLEEHCDHLLHSAATALEPMLGDDPDMPLLRRWYFNPRLHAATVVDEAIALSRLNAA